MDKARLVEVAPYYYALAIISFFERTGNTATQTKVSENYRMSFDEDGVDEWDYANRPRPFALAVDWLELMGLVTRIGDDFGPTIIQRIPDLSGVRRALRTCDIPAVINYISSGEDEVWLRAALQNLERAYSKLKIKDSDFDDREPDREWTPLPLDRDEPELEAVIVSLDETIEAVRGDNGYAEHMPEERSYVLDGLVAFSKKLKEATTISVPYLRRYAVEPISMLAKRFSKTALEITIAAAKEAIKTWLTKHGLGWLDTWL